MRLRTWSAWVTASYPATVMLPAVGSRRVTSIRITVVLPAPLGPRKP